MQYKNKYGLPQSLVDIITKNSYDPNYSDVNRLGITTLLNPPLMYLLQRNHWKEMEEDVSEHLWRILGSATHEVLRKIDDSERMIEEKFEEQIEGTDIVVVGKIDLYNWNNSSIEDYKITSIWTMKFTDSKEWEEQLNSYAWLLRKKGLPVERLAINALIKDWRRGEVIKFSDYPPIPFIHKSIKLWPFEKQEQYIQERVKLYKEAIAMPIENVGICSPKERWKKNDEFAVYKNKLKTASRVLTSEQEAKEWAEGHIKKPDIYRIELRRGADLRCTEYCNVHQFCRYWQETYGDSK